MKIMTYNIGGTSSDKLYSLMKCINGEKIDVLILTESEWLSSNQNRLNILSKKTDLPYYYVSKNSDNNKEITLLSKYKLASEYSIPKMRNAAIVAVLELENYKKLRVVGLHLTPDSEERRLDEIKRIHRSYKENDIGSIIAGDLNSIYPGTKVKSKSKVKNRIHKPKYDVINYLLSQEYKDAANNQENLAIPTVKYTEDEEYEYFDLRLDYIFYKETENGQLKAHEYKVLNKGKVSDLSDHFPVVVTIDLD